MAPRASQDDTNIKLSYWRIQDGLRLPMQAPVGQLGLVTTTHFNRHRPDIRSALATLPSRLNGSHAEIALLGTGDANWLTPVGRERFGITSPQVFELVLDVPAACPANITIVELNAALLERAFADAQQAAKLRSDDLVGLKKVQGDIAKLKFDPESFHTMIITHVMYQVLPPFDHKPSTAELVQRRQVAERLLLSLKTDGMLLTTARDAKAIALALMLVTRDVFAGEQIPFVRYEDILNAAKLPNATFRVQQEKMGLLRITRMPAQG